MAKIKIPKIKPSRPLCEKCREWIDGKDLDCNDIPHCIFEWNYDAHEYLIGFVDKCPCFNEW